jgi:hypothetical protein
MPGRLKPSLRSRTNPPFGMEPTNLKGPTPGAGVRVMSRNGVSPGTGAAKVRASAFGKTTSRARSRIVMSPVASSAWMPAMSASGRLAARYASAPTMPVK